MVDSYGDGWGCYYDDSSVSFFTIGGNDVTLANGYTGTETLCLDLDACNDMVFTAGPCDTAEISWTITDAAGAELASGGAASSTVGTCVSCDDGVQ